MKKTLAWIAAFCILTMLAPAGLAEVRFEKVFEYMPAIKPVAESNYVIVQSYEDGNFGVFTTAGEEVIPYRYASLTSLGNNFLYASLKSDDLNRHALVYIDGRQLSEYSYGSFKVYDSHWALGYILSQATKESYDLKIKKKYYRVEQTDVFYVSGEENEKCLVGSLPGYALASSQVHGDYLMVNNGGNVTVYNNKLQVMPYSPESIKESPYVIYNYQLKDRVSGDIILDGFTKVKEVKTSDGTRLILYSTGWDGKTTAGIYDAKGSQIAVTGLDVVSVTMDYAVVTNSKKKQGLYSISQQKLIVPCEFKSVAAAKNTTDKYVINGCYVVVQKDDGTYCYYDTEKGEITYEMNYPKDQRTWRNAVYTVKTDDGILLISGDGQETALDVESVTETGGDGYLIVAKKDGLFGVLDWHGNEVLPFIYKTAPVITDDSQAIILFSTGYELNRIIRE